MHLFVYLFGFFSLIHKSYDGTAANRSCSFCSRSSSSMSRDSQATYIHLRKSHHVLYISNWVHGQLPFDPIDNPQLLSMEAEQENGSSLPPTTFGSVKANKKKQEAAWKDLDIYRLIDDEDGYQKDTGLDNLLKKLERVHDSEVDTFDTQSPDNSFMSGSPFSNTSSSSLPNIEITATPDSRNRSAQSNPQNFQTPCYQTPISRIMR